MAADNECRCDVSTIHGDALEVLVRAVVEDMTSTGCVAHNEEHARRVMVMVESIAGALG